MKARFNKVSNDLFWEFYDDIADERLTWFGYDDAYWWNNFSNTDQFQIKNIYRLNPHTNEVTMTEPLPYWAKSLSNGEYEIGSQLCTKDGRIVGNAVIVNFEYKHDVIFAEVVTDVGNGFWATSGELHRLFHIPKYVMTDKEVERYKRMSK